MLIALVAVAALLVAADRVAVRVADSALADRLQTSASLTTRPGVTVHGFPFLTQAVAGSYDQIDVTATDLARGGAHITRLDVTLRGVKVPLSDVLHGSVQRLPVSSLTATAVVTYLDLVRAAGVDVSVTAADHDVVSVTGRIKVLGLSVSATATSSVALRGDHIVVTARSLKVLGQTTPAILNAIAGRLDLDVPVGKLPYGLTLTGLRITPQAVELDARSGPTVLSAAG